jgi:hypothetical protein
MWAMKSCPTESGWLTPFQMWDRSARGDSYLGHARLRKFAKETLGLRKSNSSTMRYVSSHLLCCW